jgi:hypothetical protein
VAEAPLRGPEQAAAKANAITTIAATRHLRRVVMTSVPLLRPR